MAHLRLSLFALGLSAGLVASCGGSSSSGSGSSSTAGNSLNLISVGNGFGEVLPYRTRRLSNGVPTSELISITSMDVLLANVTADNPILSPARFPAQAIVPGSQSGNHYFVAKFDRALGIDSILSDLPSDDGLTGTIKVVAVDPSDGTATDVAGRAFINGKTYAGTPEGSPLRVPLQEWVARDGGATVVNPAIDNDLDGIPDGLGFPGTNQEFAGAERALRREHLRLRGGQRRQAVDARDLPGRRRDAPGDQQAGLREPRGNSSRTRPRPAPRSAPTCSRRKPASPRRRKRRCAPSR